MMSTSLSTAPAAAAASAGGMVGGRSPENCVAPSGSTWTLSHPALPAPADLRVARYVPSSASEVDVPRSSEHEDLITATAGRARRRSASSVLALHGDPAQPAPSPMRRE